MHGDLKVKEVVLVKYSTDSAWAALPYACTILTFFFGSSHLEFGFSCATNSPKPDTVGAYTLFEVPFV